MPKGAGQDRSNALLSSSKDMNDSLCSYLKPFSVYIVFQPGDRQRVFNFATSMEIQRGQHMVMGLRFPGFGPHGWFDRFPKPPAIPGLLSCGGSIQGPIKVPNGRGYFCMIRNRLTQDMRHHSKAPTWPAFLFDGSPL